MSRISAALAMCCVITALVVGISPTSGSAQPATHTVTTLADAGPGSLRQAIADAGVGDTILFAVQGTITLATALTVDKDLTIRGPGPEPESAILSGGQKVLVLRVVDQAHLQLEDLTVADGRGSNGGGIDVRSAVLTLRRAVVRDNRALVGGGIFGSDSRVEVYDSQIVGNQIGGDGLGGGIAMGGILHVVRTTIAQNSADLAIRSSGGGGGISISGDLTLLSSTVASNAAHYGGGIDIGGRAWIANSTIADNTAVNVETVSEGHRSGGGIRVEDRATLTLVHTTVARNTVVTGRGGGVYAAAGTSQVALDRTVLADNGSGNCGGAGTFSDLGGNLQYPDTTCGGTITVADPRLEGLADNGGATRTLGLAAGSAAIDAVPSCASSPELMVDQRGYHRPVDGDGDGIARCDSGAFEAGSNATPTPGYTPPVTSTPGPQPDLAVKSIWITLEDPGCYRGQPLGTRVGFENRGGSASGPFFVEANGQRRYFSPGLAAGADAMLWVPGVAAYGDETVAIVDPTDLVVESNEANNQLSARLPVPTPPAPCATETPTLPVTPTATPTDDATRTPSATTGLPTPTASPAPHDTPTATAMPTPTPTGTATDGGWKAFLPRLVNGP